MDKTKNLQMFSIHSNYEKHIQDYEKLKLEKDHLQ
jgi:hypothetical protein